MQIWGNFCVRGNSADWHNIVAVQIKAAATLKPDRAASKAKRA
jgi:hypothetical protein